MVEVGVGGFHEVSLMKEAPPDYNPYVNMASEIFQGIGDQNGDHYLLKQFGINWDPVSE